MTNRQIETSREIRLWTTGIIVPVILGTATIFATNPHLIPVAQEFAKKSIDKLKRNLK